MTRFGRRGFFSRGRERRGELPPLDIPRASFAPQRVTHGDELAMNADAIAWGAAWRDFGNDTPTPELRSRVDRAISLQHWVVAGELLTVGLLLAFGVMWVKKWPSVMSIGWLIGAALFSAIALGFVFWNRAGTWRPAAETTLGYVELAIARCRMHIASAVFGWWLALAESVFALVLTSIAAPGRRPGEHLMHVGAFVVALIAGTWIGKNWYIRRQEREIEHLMQLRADLVAPPYTVPSGAGRVFSALLAFLLPASVGLLAPPRAEAATVQFKPCQLEHPLRVTSLAAECAKIPVPENRQQPNGKQILLHVARVQAISRRKLPDPLFLINGGPGGSTVDLYTTAAPAFGRVRRDRDIVLVDQRGTGQSNPLMCEFNEEALFRATKDDVAVVLKQCLDSLEGKADVAQYTTTVAVQDLDTVRAAMGYERINLYGVSYGTRVAQHYLRRYPKHTRTVILDGVVPPETLLGPTIALDADVALNNVLARCAKDESCRTRFGDPAAKYHALREALQTKPVPVSLPHPVTGAPHTVDFGPMHLATVLRLGIYTSEQAALVPLELDLAHSSGNFVPLAGQFLTMSNSMQKTLAVGMHNSVACAEDVPYYDPTKIDRAALERTFLGTVQVDTLEIICKTWPRGPMDADFHAPLKSDVPVLLLSGGNDPVTPPRNGEEAKRGLTQSLHLVLPDLGHGQLTAPCMDSVMSRFITAGSVKALDVKCVQNAKPMPFFTSIASPPP